jgi:hypothetical protein
VTDPNQTEAARLSRLLFEAREQIDMWADVVESRTGQSAEYVRRVVAEIDAYRAEHGWSPHGFGGETRHVFYNGQYIGQDPSDPDTI